MDGADKLLTSVVKRLDTAVFLTIQDVASANFSSGTINYSLANGGAALAPYHEADGAVPEPIKARLALVEQAILNGNLDVNSDVCFYPLFLPLEKNVETQVVVTPTP